MHSSPPDARAASDVEHHRTLLEMNTGIMANLMREALFHVMADAPQRVVPCDRTAIFLHETRRNVLRLFGREASMPSTLPMDVFPGRRSELR